MEKIPGVDFVRNTMFSAFILFGTQCTYPNLPDITVDYTCLNNEKRDTTIMHWEANNLKSRSWVRVRVMLGGDTLLTRAMVAGVDGQIKQSAAIPGYEGRNLLIEVLNDRRILVQSTRVPWDICRVNEV